MNLIRGTLLVLALAVSLTAVAAPPDSPFLAERSACSIRTPGLAS
jgi:hypothetical protein